LGSRIDPAGSTAQRPEVLDANAGRRTLFGAEGRRSGCSRGCSGGVGRGACSSAGGPAGGQARGRAVGHSFAARGGMECCDNVVGEVNQRGRPRRACWGS
jgi:hypothetical protein